MRPRNNNARFFLVCVTNNLPKIFSTALRDLGWQSISRCKQSNFRNSFTIFPQSYSQPALFEKSAVLIAAREKHATFHRSSIGSRVLVYQSERGLIS
jgi:hypothetical protein